MVEFCYSRLEDGKDVFGLKLENVGPTFSSYEYMNVIYVNCGVLLCEGRSSQLSTQLLQLRKESLKNKNSGLYGIRTLDLWDTGAAPCQLS